MPTQTTNKSEILVPVEIIQNKIYLIRGLKVMLDKDLARKLENLEKKLHDHDKKIIQIFDVIRQMMAIPAPKYPYKSTRVGFIVEKEDAQ